MRDWVHARVEGIRDHSGVVHVLHALNPGGAELRTLELVAQFDLAFDFLCVSGSRGRLADAAAQRGDRVTAVTMTPIGLMRTLCFLRRLRPRVMHSHVGLASGPLMVLAWAARVPRRIAHFRSDQVGGPRTVRKTVLLAISRRLIRNFATDLVGVSPGTLAAAWDENWADDPRCKAIPNGIDGGVLRALVPHRKITGERDALTVVHVGRSDPAKNRERVLSLFLTMAERRMTHFVLVGRLNDDERTLVTQAEQTAKNQSTLEVLGEVDREAVVAAIVAADVMLLPSRREGLPGAVLEAVALGTPVVASDLPGVQWIAENVEGVATLPLAADDWFWCDAIEEATAMSDGTIRRSFDQSPFAMSRVVPAFAELWGVR